MAFEIENLHGVMGEILHDTRPVTDPWGFGITAVVLRADHLDWKTYLLDQSADRPLAQKIRRVTAENVFQDSAPEGFRKTKKLSKAQAHEKMVSTLSEKDEVTTDIADLRSKKEGIARILCRSLAGITRQGQPVDLSMPEARLQVLDHAGYEFQSGGETKFRAIPIFVRDASGEVVLDENEEPKETGFLYAGMNMGDAIAQWLWDEAKDLGAFSEVSKADALEPFVSMSSGSTATGSPAQPTSAE